MVKILLYSFFSWATDIEGLKLLFYDQLQCKIFITFKGRWLPNTMTVNLNFAKSTIRDIESSTSLIYNWFLFQQFALEDASLTQPVSNREYADVTQATQV